MGSSAAINLGEGAEGGGPQERASLLVSVVLGGLGVALGLSQVVHGLYDETTWAPVALATLVALLAAITASPRRIMLAAVVPLLGLALLSLVSSSWAESADNAWSAAGRWLLYAAALALLLWLLAGQRRRAQALLIGCAVGVLAVGLWTLLEMLRGRGTSLFLGNRLNDPLGYVNGQAGFLLAGLWPCCGLAERRRPALVAGIGMAGIVVLVGLGALTHSRSWEIGLACSLVLVVCALPGRRRRILIVLAAALSIYLIHGRLGQASSQTVTSDAAARRAASAIVLAALMAGAAWAGAAWWLERLAPAGSRHRAAADRIATGLVVVLALVGAVALGAAAGRIARTVRNDYRAFVHLAPSPGSSRFLSGGGNRYEYWRVAWLEFRSAPVGGVGAGNYSAGYYRHRRISESITQPHSLELQTLAELGVVGFAFLVALVVAVGLSIFKVARLARQDASTRYVAVAGAGGFVGWLAQTSADWEHLLPGLTLIALAAAAALQSASAGPSMELAGRSRLYAVAAVAVIVCAGAIQISPRIVSLDAQSSARAALQDGDARAAITNATRALQYDGDSVSARVLRAAAFARLDAFALARGELQQALATEPNNWTTWALLGDLLTRRGDVRGARVAYRHAQNLDPLDAGVTHG